MARVLWAVITEDKKCILKMDHNENYVLTTKEEKYSSKGERYKLALFARSDYDINTLDISLSKQAKQIYGADMPSLIISRAIRGTKKEIENYYENEHKREQVEPEQPNIVLDDCLYVIMTEDKKCIVRGRKNTRYVLATLDEQCNYKVFTCRQYKIIVDGMNDNHRHSWVYLTDNVKKLYSTDQGLYNSDTLPKLIAVKAQTQYKIQL